MSASFPKGTKKSAEARRYAVATHESEIASIWNAVPIVGSAMLTAEPSKGVRKPARMAIRRTIRFSVGETAKAGVRQIAGSGHAASRGAGTSFGIAFIPVNVRRGIRVLGYFMKLRSGRMRSPFKGYRTQGSFTAPPPEAVRYNTTPNHAIYDTITITTTSPIRILYPHFSQIPKYEG